MACSDRTRCNGFKLKEGRFRADFGKKLSTMRVLKYWNKLPGKAVDVPSLGEFKARFNGTLRAFIPACGRGTGIRWFLMVFSSSTHSMTMEFAL